MPNPTIIEQPDVPLEVNVDLQSRHVAAFRLFTRGHIWRLISPYYNRRLPMLRPHRFILLAVSMILVSSCQDIIDSPTAPPHRNTLNAQGQISPRSAEPAHSFVHLSDAELWQYVRNAGNKVILGMKEPGAARGIYLDKILISSARRAEVENAILAMPGVRLLRKSEYLPILQLQIPDSATMVALRKAPFVDYLEPQSIRQPVSLPTSFSQIGSGSMPVAFDISENWSSCSGLDDWTPELNDQTSALGDVIGWSQSSKYTHVTEAWARSQGDNIRVAIIDTGLDPQQEQFADWKFQNDGRQIIKTHADSDIQGDPLWRDTCNHGTRIAGVIGAPLDGIGMVGIAYKSDLITIHADDDVYMDNGGDVVWALDIAAFYRAHIVQMAFKSDKWFSGVSDAIRAYYNRSPGGVLFVGAAGTTPSAVIYKTNVVFPAEMDEVIAVSAIQRDGSLYETSHHGPAVDVAGFVHQPSPNVPSLGNNGPVVRIRGTSAASATISGIAALVWGRYSSWTNKQVRDRLISSASHYPAHRWSDGYGYINAYQAVGGFISVTINAPRCVTPYTNFDVGAYVVGEGPFSFLWSGNWGNTGATAQSTTYTSGASGETMDIALWVEDLVDGSRKSAYQDILVMTQDEMVMSDVC